MTHPVDKIQNPDDDPRLDLVSGIVNNTNVNKCKFKFIEQTIVQIQSQPLLLDVFTSAILQGVYPDCVPAVSQKNKSDKP